MAATPPNQTNVLTLKRSILIILLALTAGCASTPEQAAQPAETELPKVLQHTRTKPAPPPVTPTAIPSPTPAPAESTDTQIHKLVTKLLPAKLKDKEGWANDIQSAFKSLQISPKPENFCAVIAIIEQESTFQADPVVPGLPAIVRREITQRSQKYSIPQRVIDWMLETSSQNGRSYSQRIDALKTEKELSDLIEEIVDRVPAGKDLFPHYNPIRTGGPMQVSVEFAEAHARVRHYPYALNGGLRNEVFSRRGGIYFGSAILLDYPAPYDNMLYRFADFNAGRYSSRNAAFQQALSKISGRQLATDGDLLRYKNGAVAPEPSATLTALLSISHPLKMNEAEIQRDLLLEKLSGFGKSALYNRLFALADKTGTQARVAMPQINLTSPKIRRKLTTEWFANRVYGRYQRCLHQAELNSEMSPLKNKSATH